MKNTKMGQSDTKVKRQEMRAGPQRGKEEAEC